ncbi:P-loop containing nucleoside triphosphate hydrolase protein [Hypomontagnella monticulosa]|nr:P-loop containing nucleoside triphosphate hydrolase protein [Hypomontagnella monticulosa]
MARLGVHLGVNHPWCRHLRFSRTASLPPIPKERTVCPETSAGWFSRLVFGWMKPLLTIGRKRPLEPNDIWLVNPDRGIEVLSDKFRESFHKRDGHKYILLFALYNTFAREFWISGVWQFMAALCQVCIPLALRFLLLFITEDHDAAVAESNEDMVGGPDLGNTVGLIIVLLLLQFVQGVSINQFSYHGFMLGAEAKGVLVAAMFEKTTKLSGCSLKSNGSSQSTVGTHGTEKETNPRQHQANRSSQDAESVINLMSSDIGNINQAARVFHHVWAAPMTIILASAIVLANLSYSAVAGILCLMTGIPILTLAVKIVGKRKPMLRKLTNARVALTQEVLRHVGIVKCNAYESYFLEKLKRLRMKELAVILEILTTKDTVYAISTCLPVFASVLALTVYSMTDHKLTPSTVFSSVVVFNTLRLPFASLSVSVRQVADGWSAVKRLQEFLLMDEHREDTVWDRNSESAIDVKEGTFAWGSPTCLEFANETQGPDVPGVQNTPYSLSDINFSVSRRELIAVVGATGSGKTSLLCALAGQMPKIRGEVRIGGISRVLCPQDGWIQNASLRDNILFGKPMDNQKYTRVLESCALTVDIATLPAGDHTEIGERGANLSGGQRQRVGLARAIYADSDLILLDDPLSAVDSHVGQHLFKEAICGVLKGKTRILVTHQQALLRRCNKVLWMEDGRIRALDTYSNLFATEPEFRAMLETTAQIEDEKEAEREPNSPTSPTFPTSAQEGLESKQVASENKLRGVEGSTAPTGSLAVFKAYVRSSGCLLNGIVPILLLVLAQGAGTMTLLWLSYWTSNKFPWLPRENYIVIYLALAMGQAMLIICCAVAISMLGVRASRDFLDRTITRVIGAPMSFHESEPLGRTVNLFTQDADVMDQKLPDSLGKLLSSIASVTAACILVICYFPLFVVALVPLVAGFFYVAGYYRPSERQLKRHEASLRGAMFSRFSESVSGMQTIQAYGMHSRFVQKIRDAIDDMNAAMFLTFGAQRWLAVWLDLSAVSAVMATGLLVIFGGGQANPSVSGAVLSSVLALRIQAQSIVQQLGEFGESMNSADRLYHHRTQLPEEATEGKISMTNLSIQYRPGNSMKIGIVGRTGAGKSSLVKALFRLVEFSGGKIAVDGLDIKQVPLHILRSRISVISQDPILFRGTIRSNIDPFGQYTDVELWDVLHRVGMDRASTATTSSWFHLDAEVEEGGANYSQGQRQLLSIARALLRNTRILICDEATSSLDPKTEAMVQEVMLKAFANKTVLTIAHRLRTILSYDRICVLEEGRIAGLDTPIRLWEQHDLFRSMCDRMNIERKDFGAAP